MYNNRYIYKLVSQWSKKCKRTKKVQLKKSMIFFSVKYNEVQISRLLQLEVRKDIPFRPKCDR